MIVPRSRMRVALIASSLRLAGAEKQFVYMARALQQAGVDVRVFYLGAGDHYFSVLVKMGIPVRQIFKSGRPLLMLAQLLKEAVAFKPHIALASQFGDLIFAIFAAHACGALVLGGVRSDGFYELRTSGRRSWLMLRLCHGLIANSHRAKENLLSTGIDPQKIAVLTNVIDLVDFDYKAAQPIVLRAASDRIKVTAIGSLQRSKRFDRFLEGVAWARRHNPTLFGIVAGKDLGEKSSLESRAKGLELLPGHIEFIGECHQIPGLLAHSRVLVLCSEYEGFPNVILEAMAARVPVLATAAGDSPRIVQHGITGYMIQPDDPREMGECILKIVNNSVLATQMGEAARKRIELDYNFNSLAERLLSAFSNFARAQKKGRLLKVMEQKPLVTNLAQVSARVLAA